MRAIRVILVIAVAMVSVLGLNVAESNAAGAYYYCTVLEAGASPGLSTKYRFKLTADNGTFDKKYFYPNAGYEKDMLAIALTAMVNGKKVRVYTDYAPSGTSKITQMYLAN